MKEIFFLIVILAYSNFSYGESFTESLADTDVSHFQLLINNLNLYVVFNSDTFFKKEPDKTEMTQKHVRFSASKKDRLIVSIYFNAPVKLVTRAKCQEVLSSAIEEKNTTESIAKSLIALSFFEMTNLQAKEISESAFVNVYIVAQENPELTTSCSSAS